MKLNRALECGGGEEGEGVGEVVWYMRLVDILVSMTIDIFVVFYLAYKEF